jgi:hypothetical protein
MTDITPTPTICNDPSVSALSSFLVGQYIAVIETAVENKNAP